MSVFEQKDFFNVTFSMPLLPYNGFDFSKKCFVFPGQGAAFPQMGFAELQHWSVLQQRFQVADALAKTAQVPAPSLYVENPDSIPAGDLSTVRNLALFTMSVGLFDVLLTLNEKPQIITSHSFGEYAAFVASGILSFEDAFEIVLQRERLSPPDQKLGCMIAVSGDAQGLRNIEGLESAAFFANINSAGQTVLSVAASKRKEVLALLKKHRIAAKVLDGIPQPYHSPLMEDVAGDLESFLRKKRFTFRPPRLPVLSSVTGKLIPENLSSDEAIRMLSRQLLVPINFKAQIETLYEMGCRHYLEVSVKNLALDWVSETLKGADFKVSHPLVLPAAAIAAKPKSKNKKHDSALVGLLNKVVSSVTGYSVDEISLSKNFQEDLGVDSIKKAQIVLHFLESQGGNDAKNLRDGILMNQIRTIEDVLEWYSGPQKNKPSVSNLAFGVYTSQLKQQDLVPSDFKFAPLNLQWLSVQSACKNLNFADLKEKNGFIFYDDRTPFDFMLWMDQFRKNAAWISQHKTPLFFGLVTEENTVADICGLEGFFQSLARECNFDFQKFHFDGFNLAKDKELVARELRSPHVPGITFKSGSRYVPSFEPIPQFAATQSWPLKVAAIGGASGITLSLLKALVKNGTKKIFILGRRNESAVIENLKPLQELGAQLVYVSGDCREETQLDRFLVQASEDGDAIDLLIHGGGYEFSAPLAQQSSEKVDEQVSTKVTTIRNLRRFAQKYPLKKVVCFSSTAGEFGSQGQTVYSYANQVMKRECELASQQGLPFQVISWPAWNRVGMTSQEVIAQQLELARYNLLNESEGQALFVDFLKSGVPSNAVCMDGDTAANEESRKRRGVQQILCPDTGLLQFPFVLSHWTLQNLPGLKAHVIMKEVVLPVSFVLTYLWHLAYLIKGSAHKISRFQALALMALHRRDSPYLLDSFLEGDSEVFEIRSNEAHARAQLSQVMPQDFDVPLYQVPPTLDPIDMSKGAYGLFDKELHLLDKVTASMDDRAFAQVNCAKHRLLPESESMNRQFVVLEALFHLSGACTDYRTNRVSLPLSLESYFVNEKAVFGDEYDLMVECSYPEADTAEANLYAYNKKGELYLAVIGERMRLFAEGFRG